MFNNARLKNNFRIKKMTDGNYTLWKWRPQEGVILKQKDIVDKFKDVELKLPPEWQSEMSEEAFLDNMDILKQMESLVSRMVDTDDWFEPIQIDFH